MTSAIKLLSLCALLGLAACARSTSSSDTQPSAGASSAAIVTSPGPWQSEGKVGAIDGTVWVVGQDLVTVPQNATVTGSPIVGSLVQVAGARTANGELVATQVRVVTNTTTTGATTNAPATPQPAALPPGRGKSEKRKD